MGETATRAIAAALKRKTPVSELTDIRGTAFLADGPEACRFDAVTLPSYAAVASDKRAYADATRMSQEEAARRIGKSQSAVANKLRLLKLPEDVRASLRENDLTERHGRALLRLPDARQQRDALTYIVRNDLTVAATDEYVESLLSVAEDRAPELRAEPKKLFILKDVRVFMGLTPLNCISSLTFATLMP